MTPFQTFRISKKQAKADLKEFRALLNDPARPELGETSDILPFFRAHPHLAALMGTYNPNILNFDRIAFEFDIFGDHVADFVVGDSQTHAYCFVEFEDAKAGSIFRKGSKATPEWSHRFEHGSSQIIDWILWLEHESGSQPFQARFNTHSIQYATLLVIGRDRFLTDLSQRNRLAWRSQQVIVASKQFNCITFDRLYSDLETRLRIFSGRS